MFGDGVLAQVCRLITWPRLQLFKANSPREASQCALIHSLVSPRPLETVFSVVADWNPGKHNVVSQTLLESPEVLLQGCGIDSKKQEMLDVD
ncbi:hypothetical protein TNCV_3805151 [Trichonephila clavipes]|nr:hypothetical protein TNCV_3805151 [Trichonephila clavipes]